MRQRCRVGSEGLSRGEPWGEGMRPSLRTWCVCISRHVKISLQGFTKRAFRQQGVFVC